MSPSTLVLEVSLWLLLVAVLLVMVTVMLALVWSAVYFAYAVRRMWWRLRAPSGDSR